jgi:hypothetical protein
MKTIIILLTTFLASTFNTNENNVDNYQNCKAELSVEKNRSFKSADEEGTQFTLYLKNTSSKTATYQLSTKNLEEPCDNLKGRANTGTNVNLNVSIQNNIGVSNISKSDDEITLRSGETYKFIVDITVPQGTRYNTWSCIEVIAKNKSCANSESKILSVFVPDPSEG